MKPILEGNKWAWSLEHHQVCKIIEFQYLWNDSIYRVWLPDQDAIVRIRADQLKPLDENYGVVGSHQISYIAAVARVADTLTQDVLLAPIESSVIPLPHQIRALSRAIFNDRVRYLLADEVGLGAHYARTQTSRFGEADACRRAEGLGHSMGKRNAFSL